jgi:hypothetical protein
MRATLFTALACFALGCSGPPSALDACKTSCDTALRCNQLQNSDQVTLCKDQCNVNKSQLANADAVIDNDCKNAADIHHAIYDCFTQCDNAGSQSACAQSASSMCVAK